LPIEILSTYDEKILKKINNTDFLIIGGGGILYSYFLPFNTNFINGIKIPTFTFGIGYIKEIGSTDLNLKSKKSIILLFKKCSIFSVRDFNTKNYLTNLGLPAKKIPVIGDPAIFLKKIKYKKNILSKNTINIGLNLNYSGWLDFGKYEEKIIKSYNSLLNRYDPNKFKFYYLIHHPSEKKILYKLEKKIKIINLKPENQIYIYSKLDLIVGMMLHSCVLSFGVQTPFINIGYDVRNESFGKFIKHPELIINSNILTEKKLNDTVASVLKKHKYYKKSFFTKKNKIQKLQEKFFNRIKLIIKK